ncbi:HlyD family secretion protein [Lutimonas zeaxanthinifaciens]|uniref:HlyD family secretion protein n=1 Tax=Lutimonas zeaxanthinifaciens TaxID=3060215 RepID=UPI00265D34C1|nr:biotin/lipoyl-binding protein [Lutimonas sp. YSD2104]WKK67327.1 biotin/lipoyl-binding protein [Lutimonas sp. YSD2104]
MLNISKNPVNKKVSLDKYTSAQKVMETDEHKTLNRFLMALAILTIITLFLPWTQNIAGIGKVTTLKPDQRPQSIQSQLPGRVESWFVKEGDLVKKGDTILFVSEIKSEYFDDQLLGRTQTQIDAKSSSIDAYNNKVQSLENQINALKKEWILKIQQARNKVQQSRLKVKSDSIDLQAAETQIDIAQKQYDRTETLQNEGLKSVNDLELKRLKLQEAQAKLISQQNKLLVSKNNVLNAELDLSTIDATYTDKISKVESDMFTARSNQYETKAQVSKLENSYSNYEKRKNLQYITAPQDGYINRAIVSGIGETFKEGERLVTIMPYNYELAVETFVDPIDLPLLHIGEEVRVQFDGWPAIVFSGWPGMSYGTYGARVVAIENFIRDNGKYRVLLAPDKEDREWPEAIRIGSGARTLALLNDVPIWYEIWRKLNGFPPNYYQPESTDKKSNSK